MSTAEIILQYSQYSDNVRRIRIVSIIIQPPAVLNICYGAIQMRGRTVEWEAQAREFVRQTHTHSHLFYVSYSVNQLLDGHWELEFDFNKSSLIAKSATITR